MPVATEVAGTISLSGKGAGSTKAGGPADVSANGASAADAFATGASIAPQLEALTSEIRSLRGRFEAMEPAINRLVRVEQDMTALIAEMELLANDPVPFVAPAELFGFTKQSPAPAAPLSAAGQDDTSRQNPAKKNRGEDAADGRAVMLGKQNIPTLSLGLPDAIRNAGTGGQDNTPGRSEFVTSQPSQPPIRPPDQTGQPGGQARLAVTRPAGPSAAAAAASGRTQQPRQTCDAFGIHVGSYLLQESIVFAREFIRERYASVMQGLRYTMEDIDLRDGRGLFHRLIAGPVVTYERATALCADMEASGNYCKVTFFNPPECASPYD